MSDREIAAFFLGGGVMMTVTILVNWFAAWRARRYFDGD
jgi:hypothetical protein